MLYIRQQHGSVIISLHEATFFLNCAEARKLAAILQEEIHADAPIVIADVAISPQEAVQLVDEIKKMLELPARVNWRSEGF
jgi:hypothetical protein